MRSSTIDSLNRKKCVLVIRNAFVYDFGGAEKLTVNLAHELDLNNMYSLIVSRQPRLLDYAKSQNVKTIRGWWWSKQNWSGKNALLFPAYLIWQIILSIWYLQLIIRVNPEALHVLSKDDFIAATLIGRLLGKPVIWTDPADLKHVFRNNHIWFKNPVGKLVYLASKLATGVTLVSYSEKALIEESLGKPLARNFEVIHTAGKDEKAVPIKRTKEDENAVIFCSTSRLVIAKGISELVEAFNVLSKDSPHYRLWLVGDGPDEEQFKLKAGDNKYIKFIGHSDKPLAYVAASDIFTQPTHHEGFSLALAEAAMLGKPMIASNVGGNPELVNEGNGLLFHVKDVEALVKAMRLLGYDAVMRKKLGAQARIDYSTKFDFATIIKQRFIPLYG